MKKIIVLGGGYAGLSLLRNLSPKALAAAEWTLVNEHSEHYVTAKLHKLAASEDLNVIKPIMQIIPKGVKFVQKKVTTIAEGKLILEDGELEYDELIIAAGASANPFDITGLQDALEIGDLAHARASKAALDALPSGASVAVLGAGFSGCELAGSLANTKDFKIDLIEAMGEILPMYPAHLAAVGRGKLTAMGVNVCTNHRIRALEGKTLRCTVGEEEKLKTYDAVIFTAGVRGSALLEDSFIPARARRVAVDEFLRVKEHPNIYVIGDCAAFVPQGAERPFAPTAQIACQMGAYLGKAYSHRAQTHQMDAASYRHQAPFTYADKGSVCSLGAHDAVGYVWGKELSGTLAVWLKILIDFKWDFKIR